MNKDPANLSNTNINLIIEDFFQNIKIENSYFSKQLKQPVFLIAEKKLYEAIKQAVERAANHN